MTNPDYRAMCAELVDELEHTEDWPTRDALLARARALLAQPVAEGPTDEELEEEFGAALLKLSGDSMNATAVDYARAVLARWGRPTPQPPADGEVAELAARLKAIRNDYGVKHSADCQRAADLLERLASDNAGLIAAADSLWADNVSLLDN